ncbi:hypothetical protein J6590_012837 [Homalodisca vitripennis]|nr:hypothetical protein J6590_012837 [Homalodisca vitripennis]
MLSRKLTEARSLQNDERLQKPPGAYRSWKLTDAGAYRSPFTYIMRKLTEARSLQKPKLGAYRRRKLTEAKSSQNPVTYRSRKLTEARSLQKPVTYRMRKLTEARSLQQPVTYRRWKLTEARSLQKPVTYRRRKLTEAHFAATPIALSQIPCRDLNNHRTLSCLYKKPATLEYLRQFQFPLRRSQVKRRLITRRQTNKQVLARRDNECGERARASLQRATGVRSVECGVRSAESVSSVTRGGRRVTSPGVKCATSGGVITVITGYRVEISQCRALVV